MKAAGFQSIMETLHTQAGVSQSALKSLGNGVLSLAGQVGAGPDSLAEALYHVESSFASTGISGAKALNLLKTAAEGAAVGHANLVDVTNALDATIASGVGGVQNYSQAMGALNAIVGAGDMTMQDLANAMGTGVMAVAKSYGQNIYQVGAALATFGDNNIRGAKAATDLRMAWQAVQAPMKGGEGALQSIGLTMTSLATTMTHHGMTAAVQEFVDHLKASKVPAADWGQYVTEIFGKKAGVGIGVMVDQLGRLKSKFPDLEKGASGFGDAWKKQQETVSQQWKDLKAGADALATKLGTVFLPVAMKIVHALTGVENWLTKNKAAAYALVGIASGLGAAFGVSKLMDAVTAFKELSIWGKLAGAASKLAAAGQWLLNVAMDANPIMMIVIAIALLVGAFYLAWTHFKAFRDFWKDAWKDIKNWLDDAWHFIENRFDAMAKTISDAWQDVKKTFQVVWTWIVGFIQTQVSGVERDLAWFGKLGSLFHGWWDDAVNAVRSVVGGMISFVAGIPGSILRSLGDLGSLLWNAGVSIVKGLINGISSMIGSVKNTIGSVVSTIKNFLPFSPAKEGPLSGAGDPSYSGRSIARKLAQGMIAGSGDVRAASAHLAGSAGLLPGGAGALAGSGGGGSGGGGTTISIVNNVSGFIGNEQQLSQELYLMIQKGTLQANKRNATNGLSLPYGRG